MQYPLISEYVRAIQDASNNLDKLAHLVPVLDDHGEPYRSSGAFAVVFKMNDEQTGKCYALKCFTEEQEGRAEAYRQIADELEFVDSSYITSVKYLDKEIFVDSSCEEDEFPVLLMDWIDGETMENYIAENYQDNYAMAMLCYRFCKMAAWLRSQPFAHGDIKPDNIMVRPDGYLTLIDYDGMFVPAMKGQKSPTIGTKDFSHPLRTVDDFDETIDDFALASIALSLKAISLKPSLLDEYGAADRLLFSAEDYRDLSKSKVLSALQELMNDEEVNTLLSMFLLACAKKNLVQRSHRILEMSKPLFNVNKISTRVSEEELKNGIVDNYGFIYSTDGSKLLGYVAENMIDVVRHYSIRQGTKVISDLAFSECYDLETVDIPQSVIVIGQLAFQYCNELYKIKLPNGIRKIGAAAFECCPSQDMLELPPNLESIEDELFRECCREKINIPNNVKSLGKLAFSESSIQSIKLPFSTKTIGEFCFEKCVNLATIEFSGVECIAKDAFAYCDSLHTIVLPRTLKSIEGNPFKGCNVNVVCETEFFVFEDGILFDKAKTRVIYSNTDLAKVLLPSTVKIIEDSAFMNCKGLEEVKIDSTLYSIGDEAFCNCINLRYVEIPNTVEYIGGRAFMGCVLLKSIIIPQSLYKIEWSCFEGCCSLREVYVPKNVSSIGRRAFCKCINLQKVVLDCSISQIEEYTFAGCSNLENIDMPYMLNYIGCAAFAKCVKLKFIDISNVKEIARGTFACCEQIDSSLKQKLIDKFGNEIFYTHWNNGGEFYFVNVNEPGSL